MDVQAFVEGTQYNVHELGKFSDDDEVAPQEKN